jgi:hypothetical protein
VPDETMIPWYQELYYQIVTAARRVRDQYTGASLYFTPHVFRHSFATALAPLIGGDAKIVSYPPTNTMPSRPARRQPVDPGKFDNREQDGSPQQHDFQ